MTEASKMLTPRDHREAQKWLNRMLEDPERYRRGLTRWIARKPAREACYTRLVKTLDRADGSAQMLPSRRPQRWSPLYRLLEPKSITALAIVVLAASLTVGITRSGGNSATPWLVSSASARTVWKTRVGEVRTERLADGTAILLDTDTVATLDTVSGQRVIEIEHGRARFTVPGGAAGSLLVRAAGFTVSPGGQVFDVSYRGTVKIQPIKGGLEVRAAGDRVPGTRAVLALNPGEIVSLAHGQTLPLSATVARASEQQWVDGVKSFDNVPIREIIAEANSYSDRRLELADPSLGDRRLFAEINVRDIEMVAEAISGFLDLDIDRSHTNQLILVPHK
jgi:transmembrane sensor